MLDLVRRHSRSWAIKAVLIALIIVFIGWGGYLYQSRHDNDIARVGEHYITQQEYSTAYENMVQAIRNQFGGSAPQKLMEALDIKKQALDSLVRRYLVVRGARELGLQATPDEVRAAILKIPAFQSGGKFDMSRYRAILWQHHMTPESFEKEMADDITMSNAQVFITGQAIVTQSEILASYHFDNDQIKVAYTLFDPSAFEGGVKLDAPALEAFYKKHQNQYMEPEKREITYVLLNVSDLEKDINPSEAQIKQYYDDNTAEFTGEKQVSARRILLRLTPGASAAQIKEANAQAAKILAEVRKGKDFALLAQKYSQDKTTAKKGGELGFFSYKQMSPAFSSAAFALKPGQVSAIVRTPSGLNIIKVEQVKKAGLAPLDAVQNKIIKELKTQQARDLAYKKAQHLRDLAYARQDLAKAALELKMKASDPVWITLNQPAVAPLTKPIIQKLFGLTQGDVSDMLDIPGGYMVAQVKVVKAPQPAPFAQVKDKVTKDFRLAQANKLALKQAKALLESARAKNSLETAAKAANVTVLQSAYFSRKVPDKDLKLLQGTNLDSVLMLGPATPFPQHPIQIGSSFMVCRYESQKIATAPSKEQVAQIAQTILRQKRHVLWSTWLAQIAKTTKIEYLTNI
ncbi:MAG: SurA N-terminal domain-containing protein [Syntrophobacteraceae bacterium]